VVVNTTQTTAKGRPASLIDVLDRVPVGPLVILFAIYVIGMGVGAMRFEAGNLSKIGHGQFDLDIERTVFAFLSGAVLIVAGGLLLQARRMEVVQRSGLAMVALLVFMGIDEIAVLHEKLESRTGVDWQILYLPLVVVGGVAALMLLQHVWRDRAVSGLFVAGGAAWGMSLVLEKLEWVNGEKSAHYVAMMIPEELLEITGSFLIALSILLLIRRRGAHVA
jgi:hypothetical protein